MYSVEYLFGVFCLGGIIVNIMVFWVVCNNVFKVEGDFFGVEKVGFFKVMCYYGYEGLVILVFEWGYYLLKKVVDVLGIG